MVASFFVLCIIESIESNNALNFGDNNVECKNY